MMNELLAGVNRKRLTVTVLVLFVYVWVTDFIIHGVFLGNVYKETAHLWRAESEMLSFMP